MFREPRKGPGGALTFLDGGIGGRGLGWGCPGVRGGGGDLVAPEKTRGVGEERSGGLMHQDYVLFCVDKAGTGYRGYTRVVLLY